MMPLAAVLSTLRSSFLGLQGPPEPGAPTPPGAHATSDPRPPLPAPRRLPPRAVLALATLCAVFFLLRLNAPFLYDDSEARYAAVAREMAQTGEWLAPRFQGHPVHKPPLMFWLMEAARAVLGDGEAAARLPSAIAGVAAVVLTASLGARLFGPPAGLLGGVLVATMFQFIWTARKGQLDMPLTAFVVGAQVLLFRALHEGRAILWAGGYACVALGVMAKGLTGAVLPLGTLGVYAALTGRVGALWRGAAWPAAAGAAATVVAYYGAVGPRFVRDFFYEDHVRRAVVGVDVVEPFWWYVPFLALAVLPYAGWLPFAAAAVSEGGSADGRGAPPPARWWRRPAGFPVCWFAFWFVLISASRGKQEQYVVPLMPPLAMLMAAGVLRMREKAVGWWVRLGVATVPASVTVGSAVFLVYLSRKNLLAPWPGAAFGMLALVGIVAGWGAFRWSMSRAVGAALVAGTLTALAVIMAALPPLERDRTAAPIVAARALRAAVGEAPVVAFGGPYTPTPRVTYYMKLPRPLRRLEARAELEAFLRADRTSYLLLQRPDWEALERARPLGRPVALQVATGRADYVLLSPPPPRD